MDTVGYRPSEFELVDLDEENHDEYSSDKEVDAVSSNF